MNKIEYLTTEQERQLVEWRDYWLTIGRSTAPADRATAEAAICKMYAWLGEDKPYFWWCDGPAVGSLVRAVLRDNLRNNLRDNLWDNLRDNLWNNLWNNLGDNLWDNLRNNLRNNLRDNLGDNLRNNLRDNLWDNLWDNLGDNLGDNLRNNLRDNLRNNLRNNLRDNLRDNLWENLWNNLGDNLGDNLRNNRWYYWGQHECYWYAWAEFPHKFIRPMHASEQEERLQAWLDISRSCGWWQPYKGVVFICERPLVQAVDEIGRLHHDNSPAILCRDGWPVYAWHGVRVNYRIIEHPFDLTVKEIREEQNVEVRRVMIARYGMSRYLMDSNAKKIAEDKFGELYHTEIEGDEPLVMVKVMNSTPEFDGTIKPYFLRVQPELRPLLSDGLGNAQKMSALNAIASTFGMTGSEYLKSLVQET